MMILVTTKTKLEQQVSDHFINVYLSKVLTERFSNLYQTQSKEDIRFYILTLV